MTTQPERTDLVVRFKSKTTQSVIEKFGNSITDVLEEIGWFSIRNWTSYTFDSDFFIPTDGFTVELSDDRVENLLSIIDLGDPVELYFDDKIQCSGYVERIDLDYDREGGTTLKISGRDKFGLVCDSMLLPSIKITENDTYISAIMKVLGPFGFTEDQIIGTEQSEIEVRELEISCGQPVGICIASTSGRKKAKKLTSQIGHQLKPQKGEGAMQYLQRICARAGWIIKLMPAGDFIWVGPPLYERTEAPIFDFIHRKGVNSPGNNNVLKSNIQIDWTSQPSFIVGEATAYGGKHRKGISNVVMPNDLIIYDQKLQISQYIKDEIEKAIPEGSKFIRPNAQLIGAKPKFLRSNPEVEKLRLTYIYDDEAKSIEELEYIVRYKMAEFNDKFFTAEFEVDGHLQNDAIWQINTLCTIDDDAYPFLRNASYWIQGRTFTKSRSGGTKTKLKVKLPYVWDFYTGSEFDQVFNLDEVAITAGD